MLAKQLSSAHPIKKSKRQKYTGSRSNGTPTTTNEVRTPELEKIRN